jgi:hypothetical protein
MNAEVLGFSYVCPMDPRHEREVTYIDENYVVHEFGRCIVVSALDKLFVHLILRAVDANMEKEKPVVPNPIR